MVINMWLLPQGKQVIVETYNGETRKINIKDFYKYKNINTKFKLGNRTEVYHGANNYLFWLGNPLNIDHVVLEAVLKRNFVDTKNAIFESEKNEQFKGGDSKIKNLFSEEEDTDQIKKNNAIHKLRKNFNSSKITRALNHNIYRTIKIYNSTENCEELYLDKWQRTLSNLTKDLNKQKNFHDFSAHQDNKMELDQKFIKK